MKEQPMSDEKPMGQVIQIDEARIRDHLGELVRGTPQKSGQTGSQRRAACRDVPANRRKKRNQIKLTNHHKGSAFPEQLCDPAKPLKSRCPPLGGRDRQLHGAQNRYYVITEIEAALWPSWTTTKTAPPKTPPKSWLHNCAVSYE
jgi:hypothetical protein